MSKTFHTHPSALSRATTSAESPFRYAGCVADNLLLTLQPLPQTLLVPLLQATGSATTSYSTEPPSLLWCLPVPFLLPAIAVRPYTLLPLALPPPPAALPFPTLTSDPLPSLSSLAISPRNYVPQTDSPWEQKFPISHSRPSQRTRRCEQPK